MKVDKIIISVAVYLVALFNKVEWKFLKMKPSVRRELRKLREYYNNQAQELEAEIIEEKNKKIKELKLQLKDSNNDQRANNITIRNKQKIMSECGISEDVFNLFVIFLMTYGFENGDIPEEMHALLPKSVRKALSILREKQNEG